MDTTSRKLQRLESHLAVIEKRLQNAEQYIAHGVNVEGRSFLHLDDWRGSSGHPLWMRNHMVPVLMNQRARIERMLDSLAHKANDKKLSKRRRRMK